MQTSVHMDTKSNNIIDGLCSFDDLALTNG